MIPLLLLLPQRRLPVRRVAWRPIPYAGALLGGAGNDTFNFGTIGGGGPPGPPGPPGPAGPPGNPSPVTVTIVTATPYTTLSTDYLMDVNVAGPASVVLPASATGTVYIVKDISGNAATNPITVAGTGGVLIDGAAFAIINNNYGSITLVFNGTQWSLV